MFLSKSSLVALLLAASAQAQYLINELSFGYDGKISPKNNGEIPGFTVRGTPGKPEILSNRLVLTPVAPGNQRSSVWSEETLGHNTWVADVDFRASGTERAGGNLNIWLADKDSAASVGSSSVYTVGQFKGLAIVVDTYGGTGGMIRGFLNDGSVDFSSKPVLDDLVFGQCHYSYRNLGRPSQIKIRQEARNFKVEIDGRLCFESGKVQMPRGYKWGITAATPDNPDSFEVFKLVVMADKAGRPDDESSGGQQQKQQQEQKQNRKPKQQKKKSQSKSKKKDGDEAPSRFFARDDDVPIPADDALDLDDDDEIIAGLAGFDNTQIVELDNRVQGVSRQASTLQRTIALFMQGSERRHEEMTKMINEFREDLRGLSALDGMADRIKALEKEIKGLKGEVGSKARATEKTLKSALTDHHATMTDDIVRKTPGGWVLLLAAVSSQVVLVGLYLWYKRKNNQIPKKYV